MKSLKEKKVLISGASFAGLSTAYWMNKLGYKVTLVEISKGLKKGGTPVDIQGQTVDIVKRMGIFDQIRANRLVMELWEFKNADDVTEGTTVLRQPAVGLSDDEFEIERDVLLDMLYALIKDDVEFIFDDSIVSLYEVDDEVQVGFKSTSQRTFDLVFGCDGIHSVVRRLCFGHESEYSHFLKAYFSIAIVNKYLIQRKTMQMFRVPDKLLMLHAYNNKTDIVLCFRSENEIAYHYRDEEHQKRIILEQFAGQGWRTPELLDEWKQSKSVYFDKFCQIKMPSWTRGRVALVGDAGYCASPAAGKGGSLAIDGAGALADAFAKHNGNYELAFQEYNTRFRPYIEETQAAAVMMLDQLILRTEEEISKRNKEGFPQPE